MQPTPIDRYGWSPPRPTTARLLLRELRPVLLRYALAGLVFTSSSVALGARVWTRMGETIEGQYQAQQQAVARQARDRVMARLDSVRDLLAVMGKVGGEPRASLAGRLLASPSGRVVDEVAETGVDGQRRVLARRDSVAGRDALAVRDAASSLEARISLETLYALEVRPVSAQMSGYPWVIAEDGRLLGAPNVADIGSKPFADLDGADFSEFRRVLARMTGGGAPDGTDHYLWPEADGQSQRRLVAWSTGEVDEERVLFAVSAEAGDVTKLARGTAMTVVALAGALAVAAASAGVAGLVHQGNSQIKERQATQWAIGGLARAVEARDPYTRGHSENVAYYACRLAECHGLPLDRLERVYLGGLLHDIGKIGVPDRILNKPGRLEPDEFATMKTHPCVGHAILDHLVSLRDVTPMVRHHHERLDGSGYPDGLYGEHIPLEARIVAVADVFDALVTDRPYRQGMPVAEALTLLQQLAGRHLDERVVRTFCDHFDAIFDPRRVDVPLEAPVAPPLAVPGLRPA